MGSKKNLGPFLVESISRVLPKDGIILDLMCGCGDASQVFSNVWKIYASDSQKFSQYLTLIQGKGYSLHKAVQLIKKIKPNINKNKDELNKLVGPWVREEEYYSIQKLMIPYFINIKNLLKKQ